MVYQDNLWNRDSISLFVAISLLGFIIGIITGKNTLYSSIGIAIAFLSVYIYDWFFN